MIVYKVTNKINNKIYIGITTQKLDQRMKRHYRDAKRLDRPTVYFHNAILKHGEENFVFEKIEEVNDFEELNQKEKYWVAFYNSTDKDIGYNLDSGGKYCKKSETTKSKIGLQKKKDWNNEDISKRMKAGLNKATEQWQIDSKKNKVEIICPVCNKKILLPKWEAKKRTYCSIKCASKNNDFYKHSVQSREIKQKEFNLQIQKSINDWAIKNKEIILNCPFNKIETNLIPLFDLIYENFHIKDKRSITLAYCSNSSRKYFLIQLKSFCENVC